MQSEKMMKKRKQEETAEEKEEEEGNDQEGGGPGESLDGTLHQLVWAAFNLHVSPGGA